MTDTYTAAKLSAATGAIRSRSRSTPEDLVTSEKGCWHSDNTSMTERGDAQLALDRLVRVSCRTDIQQQRLVVAAGKGLSQALGGVHLGDDAGLEIEPWRQVQLSVRGPGKAVDAARPYLIEENSL